MDELSRIQDLLDAIPFENGEADYGAMEAVISSIRRLEESRNAVPLLLRWFETHGERDIGSPGPFVHFIEERPDYIRSLEESLKSKPTCHTVWMVNRIANVERDPKSISRWVDIMHGAAEHPLADTPCKELVQEFVTHQASK